MFVFSARFYSVRRRFARVTCQSKRAPDFALYGRGTDGAARLDALGPAFARKKVAVFGLGDSVGFADTSCVAAETLAAAARDAGATLVGDVLKLDESNEPNKTDGRIAEWVAKVKAEAGIQ